MLHIVIIVLFVLCIREYFRIANGYYDNKPEKKPVNLGEPNFGYVTSGTQYPIKPVFKLNQIYTTNDERAYLIKNFDQELYDFVYSKRLIKDEHPDNNTIDIKFQKKRDAALLKLFYYDNFVK